MKIILFAFALLTAFTACNSKKSETRDIQLLADSTANNNNMNSDTSNMTQALKTPATAPVTGAPGRVVPQKTTSSGTGSNTSTSSNSGSGNTSTQTTQTTTRKKGWSSAAKGAVIGGGAGAIGGAIISKKKPVQGAVIGGVVGAAGGYIIGKDIDKKNGR
ncbi:MAG: YMGG-like glycine zipper-containing protein [Ginsengibacter sp.]